MTYEEMLAQATPRPWAPGKVSDTIIAPSVAKGYARTAASSDSTWQHYGGELVAETVEPADVALIVRATKAFEPLVKALEMLDECWSDGKFGNGPDHPKAIRELMPDTLAVWSACRKALKLAKEGTE